MLERRGRQVGCTQKCKFRRGRGSGRWIGGGWRWGRDQSPSGPRVDLSRNSFSEDLSTVEVNHPYYPNKIDTLLLYKLNFFF